MKSKLKNFSLLTISTLIMAVGIYFFKFANNFTFGGITGIAVLVTKFLPISSRIRQVMHLWQSGSSCLCH